jgi:type IV pilus assembly protein PilP
MARHLYLFVAIGVLAFLPACGGGGGPQPAEGEHAKKDKPKKGKGKGKGKDKGKGKQAATAVATVPVFETGSEYSYNPIGKRDPFRSFTSIEVVRPDRIVASELQNWELDQLRLVAILWGVDEPVAMVEDPKGKGHIIAHGDLIGKKWGRVTQIKSDEVVVTEEFRDPIENRPITNEYSMKLPEPYKESD